MKCSIFLFAFLFLGDACSSSKNWTGTSNSESTQAVFEALNGKQTFTILVPGNDTYLKYHFAVNSGKLEAKIKSPTATILHKELSELASDSIHIVNQKGTAYKIYLVGKEAAGEFNVGFTAGPK